MSSIIAIDREDSNEVIEPSMLLHRPSSARSQDVRHILTRTFGDLFTRDPISIETIQNLITTRGGDDEYHERYVSSLQQVLTETETKLNEISMLEKHIMQAEAKAMSCDERHIYRATEGQKESLGLPIDSNHYRSCIDYDLLKKHNLLTPDRYSNNEWHAMGKPKAASQPGYLKETVAHQYNIKGQKEKKEMLLKSKLHGKEVDVGSQLNTTYLSDAFSSIDDENDYIVEGSQAGDMPENIASYGGHSKKSTTKKPDPDKLTWTEQLAVEQREKERVALEQLQNKTNYLKNPRFDPSQAKLLVEASRRPAKEINVKRPSVVPEPLDHVQVFIAIPSVVMFTEYHVGQVYETTLELKNISTSMRSVRVLPMSSSYFTVGLGQFPGEQGLVASGMSAQFKIRFMPDSLGEYMDEIVVQSQCAEPLKVKVIARRPPPVLTLPSVIDVGDCLVGGTKSMKLLVRNDGGEGKFCFIPKDRWPVTSFKSAVNPSFLDLPPFIIRPAIFELKHKEVTILEVSCRPAALGRMSHEVLLLCDNCQLKQFTFAGQGQMASIEFVAVDGGTSEKQPGELCDLTAQKLIKFEDLNPFTYTQKTLILSNPINVAIPFEWIVVKPNIVCDPESTNKHHTQKSVDPNSVFSIEPQNGVLEACGIANFKITFAPPEVSCYHSVLHLVLPGIPYVDESSDILNKSSKNVSILRDITAFELECKAECIPLKVSIQPYAISVNGKSLLGTTVRRQFTLFNNSVSAITFQWNSSTVHNILEVTPALGDIGPDCSADMELSITGCRVGKMHEVLWCHVKNLDEPVALHVDFEVKGPEVYIDEPDVNFGLVRFGNSASTVLTLHNESQMAASYSLREITTAEQGISEFIFTPQKGELKPLETKKVAVDFYPQKCREVMTYFELIVSDEGLPRTVAVRADVQSADVCLLSSSLRIVKLFVGMPMTQTVTLINKTLFRTSYRWGKVFGSQADLCTIKIVESGELGPRENAELELIFTAKEQVDITDVFLPCHIEGMEQPLLLSITAKVEGLQIAFAVQDSDNQPNFDEATANSKQIDFGTVSVRAVAKKYLYVRNKTSIPTEYKITVENYSARPPTPPARPSNNQGSGRKALLQKTPNIADPLSKSKDRALIELQQQLLKNGKGVAIVPTPSEGQLAPYQELVVELALYNDMWGDYTDIIRCDVGALDPYFIPIKATVTGIPLQFQMAAVTKDPMQRFGTHASNSKPVTRSVRINNLSPFDIRIDWQMFNVIPKDSQLVDFVVIFGEPFPKRDMDGNVIDQLSPSPEPPTSRPPTEAIPNTPDSTTVASRLTFPSTSRISSRQSVQSFHDDAINKPLLSVMVRKHDGHESSKPFTITPQQMIVPARDKGFISITFHPEAGNPMGEDCNSYVLGYLNLENKDVYKESSFSRVCGYQMTPMRLNLSGCIEPALLTNEFMDDEGLRFRGVASDLIQDIPNSPKAYHSVGNGTKLTNLTEALLKFRIEVPHPFMLVRSVPPPNPNDSYISLKPNESSEAYVDFCITPDQLRIVHKYPELEEEQIGKQPIVVVRKDGERQIHFSQNLKILFNSGAVQEFSLHGSVVLPSLTLSTKELDFGVCLVGQPKQKTFLLKNRTRSASWWQSVRTFSTPTCQGDTFVMTPTSGHLQAHITHVTKSEILVSMTFLARSDDIFEAHFTLSGSLGEEPMVICAKGQGSFDEKYKDPLEIIVQPQK